MNEFKLLSEKSKERQKYWDPENLISGDNAVSKMFRTIEMAGEVGEISNVVKKLIREELGIKGSRATTQDLADELADGVITLSNLAQIYDIDLWKSVKKKFNETSDKMGLPVKI